MTTLPSASSTWNVEAGHGHGLAARGVGLHDLEAGVEPGVVHLVLHEGAVGLLVGRDLPVVDVVVAVGDGGLHLVDGVAGLVVGDGARVRLLPLALSEPRLAGVVGRVARGGLCVDRGGVPRGGEAARVGRERAHDLVRGVGDDLELDPSRRARLPVGLVPLAARALGLSYLEVERLHGLPEVVLGLEVVCTGGGHLLVRDLVGVRGRVEPVADRGLGLSHDDLAEGHLSDNKPAQSVRGASRLPAGGRERRDLELGALERGSGLRLTERRGDLSC